MQTVTKVDADTALVLVLNGSGGAALAYLLHELFHTPTGKEFAKLHIPYNYLENLKEIKEEAFG